MQYINGTDTSQDTSIAMSDRCFFKLYDGKLPNGLTLKDIATFHQQIYPGNFEKDGNFIVTYDIINLIFNNYKTRYPKPVKIGEKLWGPPHVVTTIDKYSDIANKIHVGQVGFYLPVAQEVLMNKYSASIAPIGSFKTIGDYVLNNDPVSSSKVYDEKGKVTDEKSGEIMRYIIVNTSELDNLPTIDPVLTLHKDQRFWNITNYLRTIDAIRWNIFGAYDIERGRFIPSVITSIYKNFYSDELTRCKLVFGK